MTSGGGGHLLTAHASRSGSTSKPTSHRTHRELRIDPIVHRSLLALALGAALILLARHAQPPKESPCG